jgi:hypothetical protein
MACPALAGEPTGFGNSVPMNKMPKFYSSTFVLNLLNTWISSVQNLFSMAGWLPVIAGRFDTARAEG